MREGPRVMRLFPAWEAVDDSVCKFHGTVHDTSHIRAELTLGTAATGRKLVTFWPLDVPTL
jgi:hypothetical protein